jgi:hypothetical protein
MPVVAKTHQFASVRCRSGCECGQCLLWVPLRCTEPLIADGIIPPDETSWRPTASPSHASRSAHELLETRLRQNGCVFVLAGQRLMKFSAIVGGLLFALAALLVERATGLRVEFDTVLRSPFLSLFFTSIGLTAGSRQ